MGLAITGLTARRGSLSVGTERLHFSRTVTSSKDGGPLKGKQSGHTDQSQTATAVGEDSDVVTFLRPERGNAYGTAYW